MKEIIQARLVQIDKAIESKSNEINLHVSHLNMLKGAHAECLFLLNEIEKPAINLDELKEKLGADSIEVVEKKNG